MADGGLNRRDKPGTRSAIGNKGIKQRDLWPLCSLLAHLLRTSESGSWLFWAHCLHAAQISHSVCVCVFVLWTFKVPKFANDPTETMPSSSQRGGVVATIVCHELRGPISAPWPAPPPEQKADLRRWMSGTVRLLPPARNTKNPQNNTQLCLYIPLPLTFPSYGSL